MLIASTASLPAYLIGQTTIIDGATPELAR
jgi:hypothetical protein